MCKSCAQFDLEVKKINSDVVKTLRLIFEKDWDILKRLKIETMSQNLLKQVSDSYHLYMLSCHS